MKRATVTLTGDAVDVVKKLSDSTGRSTRGVMEDALGFYDWARVQTEAGNRIGALQNGRPVAEVLTKFRS